MLNWYRNLLISLTATILLSAAANAWAALAPGTIKKMKDEASDVVGITITKATVTNTQPKIGYARQQITYHAVVIRVVRSTSGTKANDTITIHSYHLVGAVLPPGPANPPKLAVGWKGTVFLNSTEGDKQ